MKKAITGLVFASLTLLVFPLAFSLTELFGYTFKLNYRSIFVITGALLPFMAVVLGAVSKTDTVGKSFKVITSLLPPLSVLNAFYYVWNINGNGVLVFICSVICIGSCVYLALEHGNHTLKAALVTVAAIMVVALAGVGSVLHLIRAATDGLSVSTVQYSIESPDGKYIAEIIDNDQGALGGATYVEVRRKSHINAFVFTVSKKPERVYTGKWGENPYVHWEDEDSLIVNSKEHIID